LALAGAVQDKGTMGASGNGSRYPLYDRPSIRNSSVIHRQNTKFESNRFSEVTNLSRKTKILTFSAVS
jgi:hypothetical protein